MKGGVETIERASCAHKVLKKVVNLLFLAQGAWKQQLTELLRRKRAEGGISSIEGHGDGQGNAGAGITCNDACTNLARVTRRVEVDA